jgi:peroxiredoxin family protein
MKMALAWTDRNLMPTELTSCTDLSELAHRVTTLERRADDACDPKAISMVIFSGELDKLLAAFVMATGAVACGMKVSLFFTFWATAGLKKDGPQVGGKGLVEKMFGMMLPGGFHKRKLSKMDMGGLGRVLMRREMNKKNVPSLASLIEIAKDSNVEINVCEMSMTLMGIRKEELIDYPNLQFCGVASFLKTSSQAGTTLFI